MDAIQAAVLRVKFRYLETWTTARRRHAQTYYDKFTQSGISISLDEFDTKKGIVITDEAGFGRHIYHLFMIRTKNRDALISYLKSNQIGCEIYYPVPLHLQECFRVYGYKRGDFPVSEKASEETLALPIYPEMTDEMIFRVVDVITEFHSS
jgi:dTDP-4-amino-4,6-dideoxygalactose transaminase